jgi:RHS repeat-associated protein
MSRLALIKPEVAMKKALRYVISLALMLACTAASASTVVYYHNDIAGSPVVATDASGQVLWRESYRPYGERLTNSAASTANDVWFTSRRQDVDTGLVYMGARYYDPVIGRFMSTDPAGFDEKNVHSFNRYAYANNNPLKFNDPDGRSPFAVIAKETGMMYGAGVVADAVSQYAAWGTVDLGMAATSDSAKIGLESAILGGLVGRLVGRSPALQETQKRLSKSLKTFLVERSIPKRLKLKSKLATTMPFQRAWRDSRRQGRLRRSQAVTELSAKNCLSLAATAAKKACVSS